MRAATLETSDDEFRRPAMTLQYPDLFAIASISLGLVLRQQRKAAQRRLRRIDGAAMRVHLALKRYRRNIVPGDDGLTPGDLESIRQQMGGTQRHTWDGALQAYQSARRNSLVENSYGEPLYPDTAEITHRIDRLLALTTPD